jgi:hypothetical protein
LCRNEVIFWLHSIATEAENGEIMVQNAKFAGKRITQDEFSMPNVTFFEIIIFLIEKV